MLTTNWLDIVPKDVFDSIIGKCNVGEKIILGFVSIKMRINFFNDYSKIYVKIPDFDLCMYGAFHNNIGIIESATRIGLVCKKKK
jgi:hypothetical protein